MVLFQRYEYLQSTMKTFILATSVLALCAGTAAMADGHATKAAVLDTYADIAEANYSDSLTTARRLSVAVDALLSSQMAIKLVEDRS